MKRELKLVISCLVSVSTAGGIWMWGYSVGSGNNTALVELVKEDRDKLRNQVAQLSKESESLKIQLSTNISSSQDNTVEPRILSNEAALSGDKEKTNILSEERVVQIQNTASFFDGSLDITLIATKFSGDPLRHKVLANVLIPGKEPFEIRDADPGSAFKIGEFQIVIVNSGTLSAAFKAFKIPTKQVN